MTIVALILSLGFVFIAIVMSKSFKLGLDRDMIIATIRASVQLLAIGYVLHLIFGMQSYGFIVLFILLMITVASQNVARKGRFIPGLMWKSFLTLLCVEIVTQTFLIGLHIIPATARYMIPISGMIIGSSMILSSLLISRLKSEVLLRKPEIMLILALGGTPRQAIFPILKDCIRSSMIPTIEGQKTLGLVQLPGMMTGQIIAGANPIAAVRLQLLIVFTTMTSAILTSVLLSLFIYPALFNRQQQLHTEAWER
ncbi:iron export ABC transporter permease subunit FetB [Paenibacillus polymyxa]|uniref:ABC transporter permease n=1 Tax=Paenibacillus polymyxa TaxID=1406 RepID=UPI0004D99EE2|nr:iron export ABC transporter permease subunit FetB [Paenibacillus polymyxa]KEO78878.1 membrane protein [Paenibacillus polymyxa]MCH6187832.1 iron export ABC transporter permease subunit FetB [Paenibacillus polymyxa]WRL57306.1 iron export ABC transporter permease subunit FetB [Paenibacillus polymyxa]